MYPIGSFNNDSRNETPARAALPFTFQRTIFKVLNSGMESSFGAEWYRERLRSSCPAALDSENPKEQGDENRRAYFEARRCSKSESALIFRGTLARNGLSKFVARTPIVEFEILRIGNRISYSREQCLYNNTCRLSSVDCLLCRA